MAVNLQTAVIPAILVADIFWGDPVYRFHPVRLMGHAISALEAWLFARKWNARTGGMLLVLLMCTFFVAPVWFIHHGLWQINATAAFLWDVYWGFHCLALNDLQTHAGRIGTAVAQGDLPAARHATSMLVGRDTECMDGPACCRAGIESLSENLTDGVISPLFWLVVGGIPAMVLFKVASTLDSMVGYKSPRYYYFGWAGARLDDLMNFVPARLTWALTVLVAAVLKGTSPAKAFRVGLSQHALVPGSNSGWSETAFAGALQLRIAGPIYKEGILVSNLWLGDSRDPTEATPQDLNRAARLATGVTLAFLAITISVWT